MKLWAGILAAAPKVSELAVQRPGSMQKTQGRLARHRRNNTVLGDYTVLLAPVTISPASSSRGLSELFTSTSVFTSSPR